MLLNFKSQKLGFICKVSLYNISVNFFIKLTFLFYFWIEN